MNKLFTENLPWKIVSLIFAFLLWMFVINTQNPIQPQEIAGIRVAIEGLEELESLGYELTNKEEILNQNFKVVVSGPRLDTDRLAKNPKLIVATLNLADYMTDLKEDSVSDNANYFVKINLDSNSVSIKSRNPQVTKITINKRDTKEQKVTYEIDKSFSDKYTLIGDEKPIISPEKIKIYGAKSDIDRVSEAKVYITAKDFTEDKLVSKLPIMLLDADGNEIQGLEMSQDMVEVKLPIGSQKSVPINVNFKGKVAEETQIVHTIVAPSNITIIGKAETLQKISKIELEPIDLSAIHETGLIQIEANMILPEGVIVLGEAKVSVSLDIVEESTLSYPIKISDLDLEVTGVGENLSYEILTPSINVILSALPNKLLDYVSSDIKATLDLSGYSEGEYILPMTIIPPEGSKVMNSPININVRISTLLDSEDNTEEKPEDSDDVIVTPTPTSSPDSN